MASFACCSAAAAAAAAGGPGFEALTSLLFLFVFRRRIAIWKKLQHPHVVPLYEVIDDDEEDLIFLVSRFVQGGAAIPDDPEGASLPEDTARGYFRGLVAGLDYLHAHGIVHRDIKPGNLLVQDG